MDDIIKTNSTDSVLFYKNYSSKYLVVGLVLFLLFPIITGFVMQKNIIFLAYFAGLFFLVGAQFPRFCFYAFFMSICLYYPTYLGSFALHPFDVFFFLFLSSVIFDYLLRGSGGFELTKIDIPFLLLIVATIVSAVFAYRRSYSVMPTLRIIIIYLAFRAFYYMIPRIGFEKVIKFYLWVVTLLSLYNIFLLIQTGASIRIFGPAWLTIESFTMTALPMTLGFYIFSDEKKERFKYFIMSLLMFLALLGTQSRAPLLAVFIAVPILYYMSYRRTETNMKLKIKNTMIRVSVIAVTFFILGFIFRDIILPGTFDRIEMLFASLSKVQGTVYLRVVLWGAAINVFLENPIFGVGIGNYKVVSSLLPELRFNPVWYYIKGFSTHNVVLQYLAETGIVGASSLLLLLGSNFYVGLKSFKVTTDKLLNQISAANFIAITVVTFTMFYMRAWTWGQDGFLLVFLFAFNVAWYKYLKNQTAQSKTD